jgi:hypothetical protein
MEFYPYNTNVTEFDFLEQEEEESTQPTPKDFLVRFNRTLLPEKYDIVAMTRLAFSSSGSLVGVVLDRNTMNLVCILHPLIS